jgi:AcrR family transcriptional regulator
MLMPGSKSRENVKSSPRKERERLARRLEIVRAARSVFAERGFDKATLEEIAERAEFGKGTVYNYFDSKEILFAAAMDDLFNDVYRIAEAVSQPKRSVRECFADYARQMIEYYHANYAFCRLMMREWVRPDSASPEEQVNAVRARVENVAEPLARQLRAAMRRKEIRRADPLALASMFIGLVHHYFMHQSLRVSGESATTIEAQVRMVITVFFDGIGGHTSSPIK